MRTPPRTAKLAIVAAGAGFRKVTSRTKRFGGSRRNSTKSMPFSGCAGLRRTPERLSSSHCNVPSADNTVIAGLTPELDV